MNGGEKLPFHASALPVIFHRNPATVGHDKGGHVNGIGMGMLGALAGAGNIPATIASHGFDSSQFGTQMLARGPLHRIFRPSGEPAGEFAFYRAEIGDIGPDIEQLDTVDLAAPAAKMAIGQG